MAGLLQRASPPPIRSMLAIAMAAALMAGCGSKSSSTTTSGSAQAPPSWALHGSYSPSIDPANFVATIDNRYFPLEPGTAFHYEGTKDGTSQNDDMVVTDQTKQILGVTSTVVRDTVSEHGKPVEQTFDWYAQDKQGNVWYMGEDSLELKNGSLVRASDSWQAGVNGALPGIIMPGNPQPGDVYRQEYYPPGEALDQAHVLQLDASVNVPYGKFDKVLSTEEWSPVEPQTERKYYVAGVGDVEENVVAGGHERFDLVSVTK
jgi:hypothetical protein